MLILSLNFAGFFNNERLRRSINSKAEVSPPLKSILISAILSIYLAFYLRILPLLLVFGPFLSGPALKQSNNERLIIRKPYTLL